MVFNAKRVYVAWGRALPHLYGRSFVGPSANRWDTSPPVSRFLSLPPRSPLHQRTVPSPSQDDPTDIPINPLATMRIAQATNESGRTINPAGTRNDDREGFALRSRRLRTTTAAIGNMKWKTYRNPPMVATRTTDPRTGTSAIRNPLRRTEAHGVVLDTRVADRADGSMPSLDMANVTRDVTMSTAFAVAAVVSIAAIPISLDPNSGPRTAAAASESGADDAPSRAQGTVPTAT